jgi:hypothetical protein
MASKPFFVMDIDGVLMDDISAAFERRRLRGGSRLSNLFRETVYALLATTGKAASKYIDSEQMLDPEAVEFIRQMEASGVDVALRTANPKINLEDMKGRLEKFGVHVIDAKLVKRGHKADPIDGKMPSFLAEDDPGEALIAAVRGVVSMVRKRSYNPLGAKLLRSDMVRPITDFGRDAVTMGNEIVKSSLHGRSLSFSVA